MVAWIDHVVLVAPTLEVGIEHVRALTGTAPMFGGRHEGAGTHNALMSLGAPSYLEVLAPDPEQAAPSALLAAGPITEPVLHMFAVGCDDIDAAVATLRTAGIDVVGEPFTMTRRAADDILLGWRLAFLGPPSGALPFLISWGETPSPAGTSPVGGRLVAVRAGDPDPEAARRVLDALGVDVAVEHSATAWLRATIETPDGLVELA